MIAFVVWALLSVGPPYYTLPFEIDPAPPPPPMVLPIRRDR